MHLQNDVVLLVNSVPRMGHTSHFLAYGNMTCYRILKERKVVDVASGEGEQCHARLLLQARLTDSSGREVITSSDRREFCSTSKSPHRT